MVSPGGMAISMPLKDELEALPWSQGRGIVVIPVKYFWEAKRSDIPNYLVEGTRR